MRYLLVAMLAAILLATSCGSNTYTSWCDTNLAPICDSCVNCSDGQRVKTDCLKDVSNNNSSLCKAFYDEYGYCCVSP